MDANVLHNISYGIYIASSNKGPKANGQIVNTVFQITNEPITIAVSVNKKNLTHEYIVASRHFSLSVLEESTPLSFIGKFGFRSGRSEDKFKGVESKILGSGCPVVVTNALCYLEAQVVEAFDCGTHTLFLGRMMSGEIIKRGKVMTYEYYHQVKHGTTPEGAPTYIKAEESRSSADQLVKYRCKVCNYIYDPQTGDPEGGVQPGTVFEKIAADWVCPVCGAGKDAFTMEAVCR